MTLPLCERTTGELLDMRRGLEYQHPYSTRIQRITSLIHDRMDEIESAYISSTSAKHL